MNNQLNNNNNNNNINNNNNLNNNLNNETNPNNLINNKNSEPLENLDLSHLMLIKNPDNEIILGYNKENKIHSNDNSNVTETEKNIRHQHYGTISDNHNNHMRVTLEQFYSFKMDMLFIKYSVLIVSLFMIFLDIKNIKYRISNTDYIISELRVVHLQMDDSQLFQIFWSFMIVYIFLFGLNCLFISLSLYFDYLFILKCCNRVLVCNLIYHFIEIILRRYDLFLILLRLLNVILLKKWIFLAKIVNYAITQNPEFANIMLDRRVIMS